MIEDLWMILRIAALVAAAVTMVLLPVLWVRNISRSPWMPVVGLYAFSSFNAGLEFAIKLDPGSIRIFPIFAAAACGVIVSIMLIRWARQHAAQRPDIAA